VTHDTSALDDMASQIANLRGEIREALLAQPVVHATPATTDTMSVLLAAFSGLGYALSARALLLLALVGAFVLALVDHSVGGLVALGLYGLFAVLPVTALEIRKGKR
jgi:hypothetical protein